MNTITDLSGATVTLEYNALKKLESNEAALDAVVGGRNQEDSQPLRKS